MLLFAFAVYFKFLLENFKEVEMTTKITDQNMQKHNRYSTGDVDAQNIYLENFAGEMTTLERKESRFPGYPIGSVAPFMIDHTGCPVVYAASISERIKNIQEDPRASLLIREVERHHRIETGWRLALMGDLVEVTDEEDVKRVKARYFDHYPKAEFYQNVHDFKFYRFKVKLARVILGFGRIAWVEAEALQRPSIFDMQTEQQILQHMNSDHQEALEKYLKQNDIKLRTGAVPKMVAVNQFGFTLFYHNRLYFIHFKNEVKNIQDVRTELVIMAEE